MFELIKELWQTIDANWLHSALLLAMFSTVVVVGVFTYLNRFEKKRYFNYWIGAWVLYAFWLGACVRLENAMATPWLLMVQRACIGTSALCMFWGNLEMVNRSRTKRELGYGIVLILVWSYAAAYRVREHLWITLPVFVLLSGASLVSGGLYLRYRKKYRGASLLAYGFILWGVHLLGFPLQPHLAPLLAVIGYYTTAALALFIALGMIVLVLEEAQERHRMLLEEFQRGVVSRRELEQEAVISEQKYRALFRAAVDAIFLVDLETLTIVEANEEAHRLVFGKRDSSEPSGSLGSFTDVLPELGYRGATVMENHRRITEIIRPSREFVIRSQNATEVPCEGVATMVEYNRRPILLVTVREITERKKFEQQLRRSEKLSALGQLVAGVAHELNNPLAVIMGYAQILTAQEQPYARVRGNLKKILHESERAAKIVRNLLTFSRPRDPQLAPVDLNRLIATVAENHAAEMESAAILFHLSLQPDLPPTMADSHQLEQVLTNLMTNAIHALSEHNGRRLLEVHSEYAAPNVRMAVGDTGPGIPAEVIPKIFDPFFTTKGPGKGTGLGLSICHSIVQEHHGRIVVESETGKGARFIIEFPFVACAQGIPKAPAPPALKPSKRITDARVLLVDDEPGIVEVLRTLLEDGGYTIESASNGAEALELIRGAHYDLIITDLCMPGLGGEALYERVCQLSPALARRIVFITGDTVSGTARSFLEGTGNRWFGKPFNLDEIQETVQTLLDESPKPNA
jgi:PAS domain S-box-containing protein